MNLLVKYFIEYDVLNKEFLGMGKEVQIFENIPLSPTPAYASLHP